MTVRLRDLSDFDTNEDLAGFAGATHKVTEGTTVTHKQFGRRLNKWRDLGCPVLGAYHVVRTPGSGGNGSLPEQLHFWLSTLDKATPWWRQHPHWIMQVDAEIWSYDSVSAATVLEFCHLLTAAGVPGWKVCYASHGQYGNSLTGIPVDLWNAAYHGQTYPGDGAADWAPYSGRTPRLWQFTSTPYDQSAFRGSLADLQALTSDKQGVSVMEQTDKVTGTLSRGNDIGDVLADLSNLRDWWYATPPGNGVSRNPPPAGSRADDLAQATAKVLAAPSLGGTSVQVTPDELANAVATAISAPAVLDAVAARVAAHLGTALVAAGHALGV